MEEWRNLYQDILNFYSKIITKIIKLKTNWTVSTHKDDENLLRYFNRKL